MRISDWSSDVCSSDLDRRRSSRFPRRRDGGTGGGATAPTPALARAIPMRTVRCGQAASGRCSAPVAWAVARFDEDCGIQRWEHSPGDMFRLLRSEEHTSELQSLMRISYAVFCLKKKNNESCQNHHLLIINTTDVKLHIDSKR